MNSPLRSLALASIALSFAQVGAVAAAQQPIRWRSAANESASIRPQNVQRVLERIARDPNTRHVIVQFDGPLLPEGRERLQVAGLKLLHSLGSFAYFAAVERTALDVDAIAATPDLRLVSEIHAEHKRHPNFANGQAPAYARIGELPAGEGGGDLVAAYVLFHADVELLPDGIALMDMLGARVRDSLETVNGFVIELPLARVGDVAALDEVMWIEPPLPPMSDVSINDSNRALTQVDALHAAPYDLDGSGVTALVYDGGAAFGGNVDFGGRLTSRDSSGTSTHATHVSGTVGGDGSASGGTFRGMAPGVTIESYGFEYDGTGIFLYSNPGDIEADYDEAINVFGADLANNSIGSNTETNGFPCNIQGDYGVCSSVIDAIVRGALGAPFRVIWANGNERQGSNCDLEGFGDYYSTAPPATAKNHITVGALNSNDDSMTSFSSWGPTDDGRLKPDISAPGCQSGGDNGVTSTTSSASGYTVFCGTSMASPTVTGISALVLEDYRNQFGGPDPRNSTLKILLAHPAVDRGNPGPDYLFGYGSVRAKDTIDFMRLGQFREDSLSGTGSRFVYTVNVQPGDPELQLTMAWDDVPATPNVLGALVNDLDLRVFDPTDTRHWPWTLDPANPSANATRVTEDHLNNIEQVTVANPLAGTWRIEVGGFDIPSGPQPYSLASSHALTVGSFVQIGFTQAQPSVMVPGLGEALFLEISAVNEAIVGSSPTLHVRYDGGRFLALPLTPIGGDDYVGILPPAVCSATPEYYVSATGTVSGTVTRPENAPADLYAAAVAQTTVVFQDDFETDTGWSVTNVAVTDGAFERGVPAGLGGRNDPPTDFDGSGNCYLTDNVEGNSDVDGGPTRLTSPVFDLSGAPNAVFHYARWMANDDFDVDSMDVEISNDGGSNWVPVDSTGNSQGWETVSFTVSNFVTPNANVVLRVSVTDNPNDSVTEAAIDDVRIDFSHCDANLADCNGNGIEDVDDIASGRSTDGNSNSVPDECENDRPYFNGSPVRHP